MKWHKGQCLTISILHCSYSQFCPSPHEKAFPVSWPTWNRKTGKGWKRIRHFRRNLKRETLDFKRLRNLRDIWNLTFPTQLVLKPLLAAACWTTSLKSLARCRSPQPWTSLWCLIWKLGSTAKSGIQWFKERLIHGFREGLPVRRSKVRENQYVNWMHSKIIITCIYVNILHSRPPLFDSMLTTYLHYHNRW